MDHPIVVTTAERASRAGLLALRFDFRGVRASEGSDGDLEGHFEDWRRAADEAARRAGLGVRLAGGFSYGARVLASLLASGDARTPAFDGLLLLAPATRVPRTSRDFGNLLLGRPVSDAAYDPDVARSLGALRPPTVVLVGENDVVSPPEELRAALPQHAQLDVLADLNHFFSRHPGAGTLDAASFVPAIDRALARLAPRVN